MIPKNLLWFFHGNEVAGIGDALENDPWENRDAAAARSINSLLLLSAPFENQNRALDPGNQGPGVMCFVAHVDGCLAGRCAGKFPGHFFSSPMRAVFNIQIEKFFLPVGKTSGLVFEISLGHPLHCPQ